MARDPYIRLHPTAGMNAKLVVCGYCNRDTGEIALPGAAVKDTESRNIVLSEWPCEKCIEEAKAAGGIMAIEALPPPDIRDLPPSRRLDPPKFTPTWRWSAVRREFFERNFEGEKLADVLERGVCLMDRALYEQLLAAEGDGEK
jgi:hypothetical protein